MSTITEGKTSTFILNFKDVYTTLKKQKYDFAQILFSKDALLKVERVKDFRCGDINLDGIINLHFGSSLLDKVIQSVTDSMFSHVSLVVKDVIDEWVSVYFTESLPDKGNPYYTFFNKDTFDDASVSNIIRVIGVMRGNDDIKMILVPPKDQVLEPHLHYSRMFNMSSAKYESNIFTLLKFMLPLWIRKNVLKLKETDKTFFCSEQVLNILYKDNLKRDRVNPEEFSPADFFRPLEKHSKEANTFIYENYIKLLYTPYIVVKQDDGTHDFYKVINISKP